MGLVEIVNPTTGRKGLVAATSKAARAYAQPPSARAAAQVHEDVPGDPAALTPSAQPAPAKNASTEDWRAYATARGALPDEIADLSRDDLVDLYGDPDPTDQNPGSNDGQEA